MPKPMPASCSRAAIERSAGAGSTPPPRWLWSTISPRSAIPGRASTSSTVPRATGRAWVMTPASSTVPTKHTSRPPAAAISRARIERTAGARRWGGGGMGGEYYLGRGALSRDTSASLWPRKTAYLRARTRDSHRLLVRTWIGALVSNTLRQEHDLQAYERNTLHPPMALPPRVNSWFCFDRRSISSWFTDLPLF